MDSMSMYEVGTENLESGISDEAGSDIGIMLGCWDHERTSPLIKELEQTVNLAERRCDDLVHQLKIYKKYYENHALSRGDLTSKKKKERRKFKKSSQLTEHNQKHSCVDKIWNKTNDGQPDFYNKFKRKIADVNETITEANKKLGLKGKFFLFPQEECKTLDKVNLVTGSGDASPPNKIIEYKKVPSSTVSENGKGTVILRVCNSLESEKAARISREELKRYQSLSTNAISHGRNRRNTACKPTQRYKIRSKSLPQGVKKKFGFGSYIKVEDQSKSLRHFRLPMQNEWSDDRSNGKSKRSLPSSKKSKISVLASKKSKSRINLPTSKKSKSKGNIISCKKSRTRLDLSIAKNCEKTDNKLIKSDTFVMLPKEKNLLKRKSVSEKNIKQGPATKTTDKPNQRFEGDWAGKKERPMTSPKVEVSRSEKYPCIIQKSDNVLCERRPCTEQKPEEDQEHNCSYPSTCTSQIIKSEVALEDKQVREYYKPDFPSTLRKIIAFHPPLQKLILRKKPIPFTICKSTNKSFNIGTNIQQVLSMIKSKKNNIDVAALLGNARRQEGEMVTEAVESMVTPAYVKRPSTHVSDRCPVRKSSVRNLVDDENDCDFLDRSVSRVHSREFLDRCEYRATRSETIGDRRRPEDAWCIDQSDGQDSSSPSRPQTRCMCYPSKRGIDYHKLLKQYVGRSHYRRRSNTRAQSCYSYNLATIPSQESVLLARYGDGKRSETLKIHNELINLHKKYVTLQNEITRNNMDQFEANAEMDAIETELESKELQLKDLISFYNQLIALKHRLKSLRNLNSCTNVTCEQQKTRRSPLEPTPSMTMTKVLRKIQDIQERIRELSIC